MSVDNVMKSFGIDMENVLPKPVAEKEGFSEYSDESPSYNRFLIEDDYISRFFVGSFTVMSLYIVYRMMNKK
jgi:hypothetical protein